MFRKLRKLLPLLLVFCLISGACSTAVPGNQTGSAETTNTVEPGSKDTTDAGSTDDGSPLVKVHFIDVGQGDSILIQSGDASMLIDAGTNESGTVVTDYLKSQGITRLDWVIGTHPHEDHIGGLDNVIRGFDIDRIMMPEKEHTTKTFEDVLDAIMEKDLSITVPVPGDTYELGSGSFTVLGPVKDYGNDLNNWSVAIRFVCGDTSFVFTGDAESEAEADMLAQNPDMGANVLKLGHHGSSTSTSDAFLNAVHPGAVVISCGRDNDYGHPHDSTLEKIHGIGADIYRTDTQGTIIVESDGKSLTFGTSAGSATAPTKPQKTSIEVHITKTGKTYHNAGCSSLSKSDIPVTLDDARAQGYEPCKKCHPPQ